MLIKKTTCSTDSLRSTFAGANGEFSAEQMFLNHSGRLVCFTLQHLRDAKYTHKHLKGAAWCWYLLSQHRLPNKAQKYIPSARGLRREPRKRPRGFSSRPQNSLAAAADIPSGSENKQRARTEESLAQTFGSHLSRSSQVEKTRAAFQLPDTREKLQCFFSFSDLRPSIIEGFSAFLLRWRKKLRVLPMTSWGTSAAQAGFGLHVGSLNHVLQSCASREKSERNSRRSGLEKRNAWQVAGAAFRTEKMTAKWKRLLWTNKLIKPVVLLHLPTMPRSIIPALLNLLEGPPAD